MFPHLLSRRGPGRYVAPSGGGGETDPGFEEQPIVTATSTGDVSIHGKVKPGAFGKFVFPLATIQAGRQYTFRYDPNFSQLTQQGKLAMVGFGLKTNNDFHIVGLRGDGSTGLDKYKVSGTPPNGWNKSTGHTETDGGAPTAGTQAGPNWIRLITSTDGTTITFQTSSDGSSWTTDFTAYTPSPYSNVSSVTTFGIALWFNNSDTGPFSILIDQFVDVALIDSQFSNVVLLTHFDGTDGATISVDSSLSAHTLTFAGAAALDTAQSKFGGSSLETGSNVNNYVTVNHTDDFVVPGAFTIECFVRFSSFPFFTSRNILDSPGSWLLYMDHSTSFSFRIHETSNLRTDTVSSSGLAALSANTFHHFCAERDSSDNLRLYINGVMVGKQTGINFGNRDNNTDLRIAENEYISHIDEIRITKGVARYASDAGFTVPTSAYPNDDGFDPYFANVVLLSGFEGADASTTFDDESTINHTLTPSGNAQIDTAQFKYGASSLLLDGNGDFISMGDHASWDFGSGAFTVEAWVRFAVTETAANYLVSQWNTLDSNRAWGIQYTSNEWRFTSTTDGTNATAVTIANAWTQSGGTWFHFACTRDGAGDVRMFIDGTQIGTTQARNVTIFNSSLAFRVGMIVSSTPANDFNGHIDELRITKGVARYTANFTVPATAFPRSSS